jgi:hypothetical protein
MPAGVPRVLVAPTREDRLHSKGRLRQQPADDSAEEDWSWAMETKLSNGCFAKSGMALTRPSGAQSRSDERHDHVQPIRDRRPFPTIGSKAAGGGYALQMLV